jgi:UDP-2-acetamido-3-amino-2,3-dideoxy-glucuronate N-acetyltransferase
MPVAKDVQVGRGVWIFHPDLVNLYGCVVGDETRIGTIVEISGRSKDRRALQDFVTHVHL